MVGRLSEEVHDRLVESARSMRSNPTKAEAHLWKFLRKKQLGGYRFRRQHVIDAFIVDFYCPQARLAIEVDGPIHLSDQDFDEAREDYLVELGYRVLRFENEDVLLNTTMVLERILQRCLETSSKHS